MSQDPIDRTVYLARGGKPHNPTLAHLEETHTIAATAHHVLDGVRRGDKDRDTARMLRAICQQHDTDPASPTFGCFKWYLEDPAIFDTNASFFVSLPLTMLYLLHRDGLDEEEVAALRDCLAGVKPWFMQMSQNPSLFYPNKCIGDAAMLLAIGHALEDTPAIETGRDFSRRFLDYVENRGCGWGEDHSPNYIFVIVEMTLMIMLLEKQGQLHERARRLTDAIMKWVAFNEGVDAVPSIRGYNFDCVIERDWPLLPLLAGQPTPEPPSGAVQLADACGYRYHAAPLEEPRQWRRHTFDDAYSVSYIAERSRLGTLSRYPLMPNTYMHDDWGLGWQSKPCSFIVGREAYGVWEIVSEDDEAVVRQHEAADNIRDWTSRHLFKRVGFHPEVLLCGHQEARASIVLREIHRLHSPTVRIADRWRVAHSAGRVLIGGQEWNGQAMDAPADWVVLDYADTAVALRPLKCRVPDRPDDDANPQKRTSGQIVDLHLHIEPSERGTLISLPLVNHFAGELVQPLLFTGWCVVLLDNAADVSDLHVTESFSDDGELPRTYGELIRTVELVTPQVTLRLTRDMLTGATARFVNGTRV